MKRVSLNDKGTDSMKARWGLIGALFSAVGASLCCIGPLVLLGLGVSGAWISHLTQLAPYRPAFIAATIGFLAWGFYGVYKKPKASACATDSYCAKPVSRRINKVVLWTVTLFIAGLLLFPYTASYLLK